MQQPHKFNIHISILCSEESVKGILRKINCKSFDANDKPHKGKTPTVSLLAVLTWNREAIPKGGASQASQRPTSREKIVFCCFHFQYILNTNTKLQALNVTIAGFFFFTH